MDGRVGGALESGKGRVVAAVSPGLLRETGSGGSGDGGSPLQGLKRLQGVRVLVTVMEETRNP